MTNDELKQLALVIAFVSQDTLRDLGDEGREEVKDERVYDISTRADRSIAKTVIDLLLEKKVPATLCDEELGVKHLVDQPRYTIVFDDIDGTKNYHRGQGLLPYCTAVAIFDKPLSECTHGDVVVAVILEHTKGKVWVAVRGEGCWEGERSFANGFEYQETQRVHTSGQTEVNRTQTVIFVDLYENARYLSRLQRAGEASWFKDFGSNAVALASVAGGICDGFINFRHKKDELAAGILLIEESGGCITDPDGNSLHDKPYIYEESIRTSIVAAATAQLNARLRELIES